MHHMVGAGGERTKSIIVFPLDLVLAGEKKNSRRIFIQMRKCLSSLLFEWKILFYNKEKWGQGDREFKWIVNFRGNKNIAGPSFLLWSQFEHLYISIQEKLWIKKIREAFKKCSQKWRKSIIFLTPPPFPLAIWTFLNFWKIGNLMTPSPLGPNLGKIWNWENFEFWEPPSEQKDISLKHLKLPKNHFKTNLFFCSTEAFKAK